MFKIFEGYHLVEAMHAKKMAKRFTQSHFMRMIACSLLAIAIAWLPPGCFGIEGLTVIEQRVIALFVFAATMWLTEGLPAWGTSFLVIVLMCLTVSDQPLSWFTVDAGDSIYGQPVSYKSIMATMADPTIMLFLGGFVLAIGMSKTQLDLYMAKKLLRPFGSRSSMVLLGFILVTAVFSAFVSNTATAAMMLTFVAPVIKQMKGEGKGTVALALAIPLGANLGGMATPIGTPPNIIALGYLNETLHCPVSFGEWMLKMVPLTLFLLLAGWMVLQWLFPFKHKEVNIEIKGDVKWTLHTWVVAVTFVVTVFLWCFGDLCHCGMNSYIVALIPVAAFVVSGIFGRRDLEEINWGVLWMVAGGFALGLALNKTNLSQHLVESIPFASWSFLLVTVVAVLLCFGLSNFISNSATAALLVPVLGVIAGAMQGDGQGDSIPVRMLVAVAVASSVAMMLPISTPPNAIAHSTGIVEQKDMIKVGAIIGLLGLVSGVAWLLLVF